MIQKLFGTSICLLCAFGLWAQIPRYQKVVATEGDGIFSLLRHYQLHRHQCNYQQFYFLNKLDATSKLRKGKSYHLPIFVYEYNGKSIRSTIGNDDWDRAVRIRDYNRALLKEQVRNTAYEEDKVLFVPYHEINCGEPDLEENEMATLDQKPAGNALKKELIKGSMPKKTIAEPQKPKSTPAGNRNFPIFGQKYAYTPLESSQLAGKVFYIVGGHGGPDPGAVGKRGGHRLCEDEYAYDVALRLCRNLVAHGAVAYMILRDPNDGIRSGQYLQCDGDEVLWGDVKMSRGHKVRLFQRSKIINDLYKKNKWRGVQEQLAIMFHVDSRTQGEPIDVFFYHHEEDPKGKEIALQLQKVMRKKYKKYRKTGEYYGTVTARDLHMLREVDAPGVYIELGNISHERDQQRIVIERNRQLVADWLFEGLIR
ncbi:MAG: N-acetylmuramoyl-L-alanine amidase [Bacteroidota bacterium]